MSAMKFLQAPSVSRSDRRAFSLIEIMIAVALMSVIILGLMAMFSQTQRAFRLGMNQSDVLEGGRIATDLIVRELEQMSPTYRSNSVNFDAELMNFTVQQMPPSPGGSGSRTNVSADLFFTIRENQTWTGIGYFVRSNLTPANVFAPAGILYRFETNLTAAQFANNPYALYNGFVSARAGNNAGVSEVLEGIVSFRVRAYQTNGYWVTNDLTSNFGVTTNILGSYNPSYGEASVWFQSNAIPTSVELELGIMESQTYERYKAIPSVAVRNRYFDEHAGNVHLFRQRIPIRKVDVTVYE